ncbi:fluoride efflux transporter FluC [Agromyces sp. MMS24-JH15]|uniref:fluoride efflux transporter FluC n=1 Tax=Agromyces sp. MMS24-JH15 TaxID=3243765 RepID=UPI003749EA79
MRSLLAVFVGGLVGTGLRLAVEAALPHADDDLPLGILLVNLAGALALGACVGGAWRLPSTPDWVKAGVGAGVLGSFTTFSSVMAALVVLGRADAWWTAAGYLAASVIGGLVAAVLGLRAGTAIVRRRLDADPGRGSGTGAGTGEAPR